MQLQARLAAARWGGEQTLCILLLEIFAISSLADAGISGRSHLSEKVIYDAYNRSILDAGRLLGGVLIAAAASRVIGFAFVWRGKLI